MSSASIGSNIKHRDGGEVFNTLKNIFTDFYKSGVNYFDALVDAPLRKLIFEEFVTREGRDLLLSHKIADKIVQRYFDLKDYKDSSDPAKHKNLKWRLEMLQLIFKCGLVLLAASDPKYLEDNDVDLLPDLNALVAAYPFLLDDLSLQNDKKELNYILAFLNYIRIAMPIIPAASNKHLLLKIVERLEGSNNHYVTGGGMKPATRRRMRLIEEEGNAPAVKRINRRKNKRPAGTLTTTELVLPEPKQNRRSKRQAGGPVDNTASVVVIPPERPTISREGSARLVDFSTNIEPEGIVMPGRSNVGANTLWDLIEAVESELVPIASSVGTSASSANSTSTLLMPPPLTPSGATSQLGNLGSFALESTSSSDQSTTGSRPVVIRPVLERNHSLFTPDLQT